MAASTSTFRRRAEPMPQVIEPMLATLSDLPTDQGDWSFEYKRDGARALLRYDGQSLTLLSRNLLDITMRYPELHPLADVLGRRCAILDGEIVALDEADRPSFARLQHRMHVADPKAVARLVSQVPAQYFLFNVLDLDDASTTRRPLTLKRYPNGTGEPFFYEKRCPSHTPARIPTARVYSGRNEGMINCCLINDEATLIWVANLASIELHTLLSKADNVQRPTMMVFDLDPGEPATDDRWPMTNDQ